MLITTLIFTTFLADISTVKASQSNLLRTVRLLQAPENCDTCYNQTSGAGNTYEFYPQWLNGSRDYVYCEIIWNYNDTYGSNLFSTSPIKVRPGKRCWWPPCLSNSVKLCTNLSFPSCGLQPCNTTWWDDLNLDHVAALYNASSATKNGLQSWSMDYVRVYASDPQDILGELMVYGAVLSGSMVSVSPYTVFYPNKNQYLVWDAGKPTYQVTDTDDYHYVLQGYKISQGFAGYSWWTDGSSWWLELQRCHDCRWGFQMLRFLLFRTSLTKSTFAFLLVTTPLLILHQVRSSNWRFWACLSLAPLELGSSCEKWIKTSLLVPCATVALSFLSPY